MKGEKYKHLTRNVAIELSKSYDKDILENL